MTALGLGFLFGLLAVVLSGAVALPLCRRLQQRRMEPTATSGLLFGCVAASLRYAKHANATPTG